MVGRSKTWMACILPFAIGLSAFGVLMLLANPSNPTNGLVFLVPGSILLIPSLFGLHRYRLNSRDKGKVLRIVAVRTETSITELIHETDLDREFILETIKNAIQYKEIYGAIDDDETFVRDVSARDKEIRDEQIGLDKMSIFGN